jgi:hypothetical protein
MNNNGYFPLNDADFENLLQASVPDRPPEEIVEAVTPWKKAIKRTLLGIALSTLTLNFYWLNYIIPCFGALLSILGVRALRNESKQFRAYYIFTVMRSVYILFVLILNTTINLRAMIPDEVYITANLLSTFLNIILFCSALYSVEKNSGITPRLAPMVALILWYLGIAFLSIINFNGFIIPWVMIIGFICIIVSLNKISKEIDEIGYNIKNSPVKMPDKALTALLAATLVIGLGAGYAFGGSYFMKWEEKDINEHIEVQEVKKKLTDLGFPENILNDMTAEDILACEKATKVVVYEDQVPFNDDTRVIQVTEQISPYFSSTYNKTIHDVEEMTITGIGVCLTEEPEGDGDWIIIHHFCWDINPGFYGTESIQLWPVYQNNHSKGFRYVDEPTGRILYTKNGIDYISDYHTLGSENYTSDSLLWGEQTNNDIFATFSLPSDGEKQRGYVMYPVADNSETNSIIDSWFNYTHQESFLQYPAVTAKEARQSGVFSEFPFRTQQNTLQIRDREIN